MKIKTESASAELIDACRRAKIAGNLEEAIRSLIQVHTMSDPGGGTTVLWGAMPEDNPVSYSLYCEAWARVAEALERGAFHDVPTAKKFAAE